MPTGPRGTDGERRARARKRCTGLSQSARIHRLLDDLVDLPQEHRSLPRAAADQPGLRHRQQHFRDRQRLVQGAQSGHGLGQPPLAGLHHAAPHEHRPEHGAGVGVSRGLAEPVELAHADRLAGDVFRARPSPTSTSARARRLREPTASIHESEAMAICVAVLSGATASA